MAARVSIIGDGGMGTLCAIMLAENGLAVRLWSAFPQAAEELSRTRENRRFLPGATLPPGVEVTGRDEEAMEGADLAVSAVPAQFTRSVWERLRPHCPSATPLPLAEGFARGLLPIVSVTKGIETGTLLRPTQILSAVLDGGEPTRPLAALSGPSIAPEVARRLPATVAVASRDDALARRVQAFFSRPYFRVYTNPDLVGVEVAGASKNVIAIAAGILDGLQAGCNAKAALLTRGIAEITRLGLALGARAETFAGLAGMGDLVTTCFSPVGRNRSLGEAIGMGRSLREALSATESVVEGVATAGSVAELASRHGVEMPITRAVAEVLFGGVAPAEAIANLMSRPLKAES
jgi:glycerol-3-phosphate dehydrogenase (NAD(P)+)